jgi:SAM-dependent MidA family methyltransferase
MIIIKDTNLFMFKGFCGHKLHDVLTAPGTADLTADVDFNYLRRMAQGKVASLGPTEQQTFLKNMGIDVRLKVLAYFTMIKYLNFIVFKII